MKTTDIRKWLLDYANEVGDEVLAHNVDKFDDYRVWKEYAIRMAEKEGVKIARYLTEKEAERPEEVQALNIIQKLYGNGFISRYGIVYEPDWLNSNGEEVVTVDFRAVSTPEEILARYGRLMKLLDGLSEGEKNILKKLI